MRQPRDLSACSTLRKLCHDVRASRAWRQLGILRDETFSLDEWRRYRASFVAVLVSKLSCKYWLQLALVFTSATASVLR